ncbi:glycosyltransferase family 4 protein [Rothia nasimurium]|uniref:glycosyltransferase family 4 protein n=1 Tax=Rothia nasimurium TaxID=85336 RepID=UPI001F257452|nr:glycosyltransferase family 4 protein [Rothia nasimurium]
MRALHLLRNSTLAATVVVGLVRTDPAAFLNQVGQRAPVGIRTHLAPALERLSPPPDAARTLWSAGQVTEALASARNKGKRRLAQKLEAEAALLSPDFTLGLPAYTPTIPVTTGGQPGEGAQTSAPETGELRVLHLLTNSLPATQSGYTLRTHRLLGALAQRGIQLAAHTRIGYPVMVGSLTAGDTAQVGSVTYRRYLPWKLASTATERLEQWATHLARTYDRQPPQLIHTTTHFHNALVAQALAERWGVPWIYEVRGVLEETWLSKQPEHLRAAAARSERFLLTRARETQMMKAASQVLTLSETMKKSLIERGVAEGRVTVVPNSVDSSLLEQNLSPREARAQLGLPEGGFWVGSVSSLVPYEGFDTLLRALVHLRDRGLDARLLLAGDGTDRVRLERLAQSLGVADYTVFLGRIAPELTPFAHQALDVFVVPRTNDEVCRTVTPLKPIEAMAIGRPVVVSDLPPLADLVCPEGQQPAGRVAQAEDPASFAQALLLLAENPDARARLSAQGRELARARTWEKQAAIVEEIYNGLLTDGAGTNRNWVTQPPARAKEN